MRKKSGFGEMLGLSDEQKKQLTSEIRAFYLDVRDEEIGIIEEGQLLDLFTEHMAPIIYNKALDDAQRWYRQNMGNLESDYYLLYRDIR